MRRTLEVLNGDAELARLVPLVLSGDIPVVSLDFESVFFSFSRPSVSVVIHTGCPGLLMVVEARVGREVAVIYGGRSDLPAACSVFDEYCTPLALQVHRRSFSRSLGARCRYADRLMRLFLQDLNAWIDGSLASDRWAYVVLPIEAARSLLTAWLLVSSEPNAVMRKRGAVGACVQ